MWMLGWGDLDLTRATFTGFTALLAVFVGKPAQSVLGGGQLESPQGLPSRSLT